MLKNREVPRALTEFNALFSEFQYKHELGQVFDDLLTMIICAMGHQTQEGLYFRTIENYDSKEVHAFSNLFGELMRIYANGEKSGRWVDPLGDYYECLAANYKKSRFGQYFTPRSLCDVMAVLLQIDDFGKNILEPCSGSGRMVLAANQQMNGNYYVCRDLDPICCKMTAINMCFHSIRGEVHCGDTLSDDAPSFSLAVNYELWKHGRKCIFYYPKA